MLRTLSGAVHEVHTGVFMRGATQARTEVVTTRVSFLPMTDDEMRGRRDRRAARQGGGMRRIQGRASRFIDWIDGYWSNVVGLPIATVYRFLNDLHGPD